MANLPLSIRVQQRCPRQFVMQRHFQLLNIDDYKMFLDFNLDIFSDFITDDVTIVSNDVNDEEIISCVNICSN